MATSPSLPSDQQALPDDSWAMRWHVLVNAPSGSIAGDAIAILTLHSGLYQALSTGAPYPLFRASALLGLHPEPIPPKDHSALFDQSRFDATGDELAGLGTYLVEIAQIRYQTNARGPGGARARTKVISVERADLTLDVDIWNPGPSMSASELSLVIVSLLQQRELELSLPAGSLLKRPAL